MISLKAADWREAIEPAATAFFLDCDGTLLDFKDNPEDVVADAALIGLLRRLLEVAGGAVALVSGRMIADLDRIMAPLQLPAAGVHGADLRYADRRRETLQGDELAEVRREAQAFVAARDGLRFEDKGGTTFALHFRRAPERADEVAELLDRLVDGRELMVQHGKMVAEVKPANCHKGIAVATLMKTAPFAGRVPFFIGDDLTDEHGFEVVNAAGGTSVKVGEGKTVAHHRLAGTSDVRDLLSVIGRTREGS